MDCISRLPTIVALRALPGQVLRVSTFETPSVRLSGWLVLTGGLVGEHGALQPGEALSMLVLHLEDTIQCFYLATMHLLQLDQLLCHELLH